MLFARKDGIVSSLQSKYGSGTVAMSINGSARWLSRVNLAVAIIMLGWGLSVILTQPVTRWFATSSAVWMALLLMSAIWQLRGSFIAIAALALATAVVSRLFSILRLNPPASTAGLKPDDLDLLVATGPGVPGFAILGWFLGALVLVQFMMRAAAVVASSDSREISLNELALTFIRVYVGLMFVPHFRGWPHIGIFHPPGCRARIRVFADVDAVGRTFSDRLCVGAARGGLRIWCVLGGNDRRVRCARRRPVFARQATMAKRAGPPPLA